MRRAWHASGEFDGDDSLEAMSHGMDHRNAKASWSPGSPAGMAMAVPIPLQKQSRRNEEGSSNSKAMETGEKQKRRGLILA